MRQKSLSVLMLIIIIMSVVKPGGVIPCVIMLSVNILNVFMQSVNMLKAWHQWLPVLSKNLQGGGVVGCL